MAVLPFQTPDFNPGDKQLVQRLEAAPCLHVGFHIGASAHTLDGERWILLGTDGLIQGCLCLAYRLPAAWGEDVHQAMSQFQRAWRAEAEQLGLGDAYRARLEEARRQGEEAKARWEAAQPKPKRPIPKPHELEGAVALPGLEDWVRSRSSGSIRI